LPAAAASLVPVARRAGAAVVPVLLAVPAAAGRLLLARALHADAGRGGPLVAASGRRPPLTGLAAGTTLYLDAGALAPETALALEALLDDGTIWVLAGVEPGVSLPGALAGRLAAVVVEVPPLVARAGDLPALAEAALGALARRRGGTAPRLSPSALAHLTSHSWPGDLAELETVLARAFLLAPGETIEAEHLGLAAPSALAVPEEPRRETGAELEFLLAELAHELRNPLVTIKTFAQHLPALLDDAELRQRFAGLAEEAIGHMDDLLENALQFARLTTPRRESIEVGPLLDRVLADVTAELAGREVRVRHATAPGARCAADPEQLAYALRNLVAGVGREVPAREELVIEATANGVVSLRFAAGGAAAERLRRLAAPGDTSQLRSTLGDPTLLPLAFRLARGVLARNGGGLAVVPGPEGATTLVVRLPVPQGDAAR
jgi:signal transduction histidine kinase